MTPTRRQFLKGAVLVVAAPAVTVPNFMREDEKDWFVFCRDGCMFTDNDPSFRVERPNGCAKNHQIMQVGSQFSVTTFNVGPERGMSVELITVDPQELRRAS